MAKWFVVVLAAFGAFAILLSLFSVYRMMMDHVSIGAAVIVMLVANILYLAAATMLFRSDAAQWFGEMPAAERPFA